jgi:hypothetical protein
MIWLQRLPPHEIGFAIGSIHYGMPVVYAYQ